MGKNYEEMSIEELQATLHRLHVQMGFQPKKYPTGKDGAILLDPNDPNDREWYENDKDYSL